VTVLSHVVAIGGVEAALGPRPSPADGPTIDESPVRVFDRSVEAAMIERIDQAHRDRDSVGGIVEVLIYGVPAGVGSHVHWDRKLDGLLAGALMSVPAIKGVEVGDGWASAARAGSEAHDEIELSGDALVRSTDRAGGTEGGVSTGQTIRVRASMKPLSTLMRPLKSVDVVTKETDVAFRERSDVCAVPAAGVVCEQMAAFVIAAEMQRSFGGDTVDEFIAAVERRRARLEAY